MPTVGRFLVTTDGDTTVERTAGTADADIRCFLEGPVAAAAAILRGELVLRAAAVSVGDQGVVICGASAAGKSALAATLGTRWNAVIADAVATIRGDADDAATTIAPFAPEPILWPDVANQLGLAVGRPVRSGLAARAYRLPSGVVPVHPGVFVFLDVNPARNEPEVTAMSGAEKLQAMLVARWYGRLADALGLGATQFRIAAEAAKSATFVRLSRPPGAASTGRLADLVEALAR